MHARSDVDVERAEGLIHKDQIRLNDPTLSHRDSFSHTAAQFVRVVMAKTIQANPLKPSFCFFERLVSAVTSKQESKLDIAENRFPWKESVALKHIRCAPVDAVKALSKDFYVARAWSGQACDDVQERRFAATAGTYDGNEAPALNFEGDVLNCNKRSEALGDVPGFDRGQIAERHSFALFRRRELIRVELRYIHVSHSLIRRHQDAHDRLWSFGRHQTVG